MSHSLIADHNRRGFALLLALFVLAIGTALVARMTENGVAGRRMAGATAPILDMARADLALEALARDLLRNGPPPPHRSRQEVDGQWVEVVWTLESGRIDLNFSTETELTAALSNVGLGGEESLVTAQALVAWRGGNIRGDGRQAYWNLADIAQVPGLSPAARAALYRWGSVAARGPFAYVENTEIAALQSDLTVNRGASHFMGGTLLRLTAISQEGRCLSRILVAIPNMGQLYFKHVVEDNQCPG
jgi:hypothetical protein